MILRRHHFCISTHHLLVLCWCLASLLLLSSSFAEETTCTVEGTCQADNSQQQIQPLQEQQQEQQQGDTSRHLQVINQSKFRADLYFDDGRFGMFVGTLDPQGGTASINTFVGHSFFVTRHGVKERLCDTSTTTSNTVTPLKYTVPDTTTESAELIIPREAAPSNDPCQDRYDVCPIEAARGECTRTPGWMIVHCCQSCNKYMDAAKLIDPAVRCTKERLNMTDPIWQDGDLEKLFQSWSSDPQFQSYKPRVLSSLYSTPLTKTNAMPHSKHASLQLPPWVMVFDEFITEEEADALIEGGRMMGFDRSTDQGAKNALGEQEQIVSRSRTSSNAWCIGACQELPEVQRVTQRIEQVTGIPKSHYEEFQILEYNKGQFYKTHHDSSKADPSDVAGPRILTFFLYLSDVEEGGATYFPELDLGVAPKKGRALVWPSMRNEDPNDPDPRMLHEAQSVEKGVKYAANHWIHLNDFHTPNQWGCTGSFS